MRRELEKLRKENATLAGKVCEGRRAITNTEQHIVTAVDDWKVRTKNKVSQPQTEMKKIMMSCYSHIS